MSLTNTTGFPLNIYSMCESHSRSKSGFRSHFLLIRLFPNKLEDREKHVSTEKPYKPNIIIILFHHFLVIDR